MVMQSILIQSDLQKEWIQKLEAQKAQFKANAAQNDIQSRFPHENIQWLIDSGYTQLTLPKSYGGYGASLEDMVILQTVLGSIDGATALSIGWHLSLIGELFESNKWEHSQLCELAKDVKQGALINRAVSEAETGSPTRGGKPLTYAERQKDYYVINGVKTFTSMSPALTHIVVAAYIPETERVGFFLVKKDTEGLSIANNWDMLGMSATESHDILLDHVKVSLAHLVEIKGETPAFENGWLLHIPSTYLGIAQAARDYAYEFAASYQPNSIDGTISDLPVVQQNLGKMDTKLITARHLLWSTAHAYQYKRQNQSIQSELSASKVVVMNEGLDVIDLAMRIVGAKSLEMSRPLQRFYRDMRAGLHNPPMEDMAYHQIADIGLRALRIH